MVPKRHLKQGAEEGSQLPNKRRHLASTIIRGLNYGRSLEESMHCLEPIIRKWVQEAVEGAMDPLRRSSYNQVECSVSRSLQLQFRSNLPNTLFTGNRLLSKDRGPIEVVLYDSVSKQIVKFGHLSSLKVTIVVLDGDFGRDDQEDWKTKEFDGKLVKNREGKRPLVAGESTVSLKNGVGYIGDLSFTDNSSWIRSGRFRLGAKANTGDEISIREAVSNAFKVKDHRGESYQKHYPPTLDDEVWRLEKIAKDGPSHKKLHEFRIFSVGHFLRLYSTDQPRLRTILAVSNKTWETIIGHAKTCRLDDNKYMYSTAQGPGLLLNSAYKVAGVTFDGENYLPVNCLSSYQMRMVEDLKQHASRNVDEWVPVSDSSTVGYPMILENPAADSLVNPNFGLHVVDFQKQGNEPSKPFLYTDQREMEEASALHRTMSPTEGEQDKCSFELGESSRLIQGFNPTFRNTFDISDSPAGFCIGGHHAWPSSGNYVGSQLSTDDLPIDDNFQVESSAWPGNGLFLDPGYHGIGIISSNSGIVIPRPKTRWCKVLAVVKWRILVRRNVAARKWKRLYSYM